uniref:LID domain-containing protein n=1 Tax=Macrostomum lignano TaxID=282301 RepID=A0A1I8F2P1_9PLAT
MLHHGQHLHPPMMRPPPPPHTFVPGPPPGPMGPGQTSGDLRVHDLNNRLTQRPRDTPMLWWDAFGAEFFEDDAQLQVSLMEEDGLALPPKSYCIGRSLIPRFFHQLMDACEEAYLWLRAPHEMLMQSPAPHLPPTLVLTCDAAELVTSYVRNQPCLCKVSSLWTGAILCEQSLDSEQSLDILCEQSLDWGHSVLADIRLVLEFAWNERARIRLWRMDIRGYNELLPRSHAQQQPPLPHQSGSNGPSCLPLSTAKPVSKAGLPPQVVHMLQASAVLEPMQAMMALQKCSDLEPRECLKTDAAAALAANARRPRGRCQQRIRCRRAPRRPAAVPAVTPGGVAVAAAPATSGKARGGAGAKVPRSRKRTKNTAENNSATGGEAKPTGGGGRGGGGRKRNAGAAAAASGQARPSMPQPMDPAQPGEVMVVGEPGLMGGQACQEDERLITRLENSRFVAMNRFGARLPFVDLGRLDDGRGFCQLVDVLSCPVTGVADSDKRLGCNADRLRPAAAAAPRPDQSGVAIAQLIGLALFLETNQLCWGLRRCLSEPVSECLKLTPDPRCSALAAPEFHCMAAANPAAQRAMCLASPHLWLGARPICMSGCLRRQLAHAADKFPAELPIASAHCCSLRPSDLIEPVDQVWRFFATFPIGPCCS